MAIFRGDVAVFVAAVNVVVVNIVVITLTVTLAAVDVLFDEIPIRNQKSRTPSPEIMNNK